MNAKKKIVVALKKKPRFVPSVMRANALNVKQRKHASAKKRRVVSKKRMPSVVPKKQLRAVWLVKARHPHLHLLRVAQLRPHPHLLSAPLQLRPPVKPAVF